MTTPDFIGMTGAWTETTRPHAPAHPRRGLRLLATPDRLSTVGSAQPITRWRIRPG